MPNLSRRDFLKLSGAIVGGLTLPGIISPLVNSMQGIKKPNVLMLLFDTTSAPHLSLYGYPRQTTPNLDRFARRAVVYNSHYSCGTYTVPGTASILTGLYPWSHRALNANAPVRRDLADKSLFQAIGSDYYRIGYGQNLWVDIFLRQFYKDIELHIPATSFAYPNPLLLGELTDKDLIPFLAYDDYLVGGVKLDTPYAGSVTLGVLDVAFGRGRNVNPALRGIKPKSIPYNNYNYYNLHSIYQGILETIQNAAKDDRPYFGYFHLWAPHGPYAPVSEFRNMFDSTINVRRKERHPLIEKKYAFRDPLLVEYSRLYDQYIANVDAEFGFLMNALETEGLLDNTCVVVLSDHGQLFERGVHGHSSPLLYDQGIHVPLLISMPGQTEQRNIYEPTSNVDLLPTLTAITGGKNPENLEGRILPGLNLGETGGQSVLCMDAKMNSAFRPLNVGSFAIFRESYKLIYYKGYPGYEDIVELYDLNQDREEINNLSTTKPEITAQLMEELQTALEQADKLYEPSSKHYFGNLM